ncbi:MAG: creatininase family protein [Cohaesibacteraceae bacterium]|nr:creatininase family protein [Cohaesibacteraceae bacterium]
MGVFRWQDLTSADIGKADKSRAVVVFPLAAIEQHGPHLPLSTDAVLAEGYLGELEQIGLKDFDVYILPLQSIGWSIEHQSFPGTLTGTSDILLKLWKHIALQVIGAGFVKLVFINSHGGNVPLMDILIRELRAETAIFAVATNWLRFGYPDDLVDADERAFGIHGGLVETAMMMHLAPQLVRKDALANFPSTQEYYIKTFACLTAYGRHQFGWLAEDLNTNGVVGDAKKATAAIGEALIQHIVQKFIILLRDVNKAPNFT